jgi:hypothetical protein
MTSSVRICAILRLGLLTSIVCGRGGSPPPPEEASRVVPNIVVRFDATIELNGPLADTRTVLFARYWVGPGYYRIAIIWSEPHMLNVNFPVYPPTFSIESTKSALTLSSQIQPRVNQVFKKPIGTRGVFRHKFNSYPIGDIRFAEPEALASRIYTTDLGASGALMGNGDQTLDLSAFPVQWGLARDATTLNLQISNDRVEAVDIMDAGNLLIKRIEYGYSQQTGGDMLSRESIFLPERPLRVGWTGRGVAVRVGEAEGTFKELTGVQHEGGRECSVEYKAVKGHGRVFPMPAKIAVRKADTGVILRTAQMSNFVVLVQCRKEAQVAAQQVGLLTDEEQEVRRLFARYWRAQPNEVSVSEADTIRQLRKYFERSPAEKTAGEELRRLSMLVQLDWLENVAALRQHFREHLGILHANGFGAVAFACGLQEIDLAVRRGQFSTADDLLCDWTDKALGSADVNTLLACCRAQIKRGRFWAIARLLDGALTSRVEWTRKQFDARALRCLALYEFLSATREPSETTETARAQATWASQSLGTAALLSGLRGELAEANRLFDSLVGPDGSQRGLKSQLEDIARRVEEPTSAPPLP